MNILRPIRFLSLVFAAAWLSSCGELEDITLGNTSDLLGVSIVDTFSVESSTVLLDPLPTAGQGRLLIGNKEDVYTGKVSSSTYFRMSIPTFSVEDFPNDMQFDSITMELFYDGYSYGDTLSTATFEVHRVTEDIDLRDLPTSLESDEYPVFVSTETLYADQEFAYDPTPLGSTTFYTRPETETDTVKIKLNNALGEEFLNLMKNSDYRITVEDDFVSYFKGLVVKPSDDTKAMMGFQDSVVMNMYYSYVRQTDGIRVTTKIQFPLGSTTYQYNRITADRSNSLLASINKNNRSVSSTSTNNRTFIEGGSGLVTKVRFPNLRETLNSSPKAISKAELVIETDQSENTNYHIPSSLALFRANMYDTPTALLTNTAGTSVQASYQTPSQWGGTGRGRYVFDITDYVSTIKNSENYDEDESILVSIPTTNLLSTVNSLRIATDGEKPRIKLNIVYINY